MYLENVDPGKYAMGNFLPDIARVRRVRIVKGRVIFPPTPSLHTGLYTQDLQNVGFRAQVEIDQRLGESYAGLRCLCSFGENTRRPRYFRFR